MSDYKAPLGIAFGKPTATEGVWGAIPDLKQFLHRQNITVRL